MNINKKSLSIILVFLLYTLCFQGVKAYQYKYSLVQDDNLITKNNYESINIIDKDWFAVKKDQKWGIINKKGEYILEPQFPLIQVLSEKYVAVYVDKKWGIINKKGEYAVKPVFDLLQKKYNQKKNYCKNR